jgi:hypothetical protein
MMRRLWLFGVVVVPVLLAVVAPAVAENFFDIFIGAALTDDTNVTLQDPAGRVSARGRLDTAFAVGGRFGHLYENLPWLGIAVGGSYFAPDAELTVGGVTVAGQELSVVPISFQAVFRLPGLLAAEEIPHGRLQPYAAVGPGLFISTLKGRLGTEGVSDTSLDVGLDARAGLTWQFDRHIGLFAEYRFTYLEPGWEDVIRGVRTRVETTLRTHHALVGITLRWLGIAGPGL